MIFSTISALATLLVARIARAKLYVKPLCLCDKVLVALTYNTVKRTRKRGTPLPSYWKFDWINSLRLAGFNLNCFRIKIKNQANLS